MGPDTPPATPLGERMRPARLEFIRSIDASFPVQKGENSPLALVQELLAELDARINA